MGAFFYAKKKPPSFEDDLKKGCFNIISLKLQSEQEE